MNANPSPDSQPFSLQTLLANLNRFVETLTEVKSISALSQALLTYLAQDTPVRVNTITDLNNVNDLSPVISLSDNHHYLITLPSNDTKIWADWLMLLKTQIKQHLTHLALIETNNTLHYTVESTQDGVWDWNCETNETRFSKRWKSMIGYEAHEVEDTFESFAALVHPNDLEEVKQKVNGLFSNPKSQYSSQFRMKCKSGIYRWVLSRGRVFEWHIDGSPKRIIGTHVDFDAQKHLEQTLSSINRRLKREQDLLTQCGQVGNIGYWHFDLTNNDLWWSDKTKEIHGVDRHYEPKIEEAIEFYESGQSRELIQSSVEHCIATGEAYDVELKIRTAQGALRWVRAVGCMSPEGEKGILYGIFQDIHERVTDTIALNEAKLAAEKSNEIKSSFLACMSHEIRTPMNGVLGMLQIVLQEDLDSGQRKKIELARKSAESLLHIINDILDLSKIESEKVELEKIPFNLENLLSEFTKSIAIKASEKGLSLILDASEVAHPKLLGDANRIRQILNNIVGNAIKFTDNGDITIRVATKLGSNNQVVIKCTIEDTGIGISPERLENIFNPFVQEDASTTRRFGGTGLGLSISKQLTQLMGGDIQVKSEFGRGSQFSVTCHVALNHGSQSAQRYNKPLTFVLATGPGNETKSLQKLIAAKGHEVVLYEERASVNKADSAKTPQLYFDYALIDSAVAAEVNLNQLKAVCKKMIQLIPLNQDSTAQNDQSDCIDEVIFKPFTSVDLATLVQAEHRSQSDSIAIDPSQKKHPPGKSDAAVTEQPKKLLVAEDDFINQQVISGVLASQNYDLVFADNGLIALELLSERQDFDLIIMDCRMPVLDGYDTTRKIRQGNAGERYQSIPIIGFTANAMSGDREACINAGMSDVLHKPLDYALFIQTLQRYSDPDASIGLQS